MPIRKRFILIHSKDPSAFKWTSARSAEETTYVCLLCDFVITC